MSALNRGITKAIFGGLRRRAMEVESVNKEMENQEESVECVIQETSDGESNHVPEEKGRPRVKARKTMFRWNVRRDASLLTEASSLKPYLEVGAKSNVIWTTVSEAINTLHEGNTNYLGVKNRFHILLKGFKTDNNKNRYSSGTEEDFTAISGMLTEIASEIEESQREKDQILSENSKKTDIEKKAGEEIRGAAFTTSKKRVEPEDAEESTPPRKRCTDRSLMEIWSDKQVRDAEQTERKLQLKEKIHNENKSDVQHERKLREMEVDLRNKELDIRRDELNHKMKRDADELNLQKERFNLEKEERTAMMNTQKLMLELLGKLVK